MRALLVRLSAAASAGALAGVLLAVSPAGAATCAPDAYERDSATTAALLSDGSTTSRAICQSPASVPKADVDDLVFTASGTTAYTLRAVAVGAALADDAYDRGGLQLGVFQLQPTAA